MKKFLLALVLTCCYSSMSAIDVDITDEQYRGNEYSIIINTDCDVMAMKDNSINFIATDYPQYSDGIVITNNSIVVNLSIPMRNNEVFPKQYLSCTLKIEYKPNRAKINLTKLRVDIYNTPGLGMDSFTPLSEYCFVDHEGYIAKKEEYMQCIVLCEKTLNSKVSKKEKKDAEYHLGIAKAGLAYIETAYPNSIKYDIPRHRKECNQTISMFISKINDTLCLNDNW